VLVKNKAKAKPRFILNKAAYILDTKEVWQSAEFSMKGLNCTLVSVNQLLLSCSLKADVPVSLNCVAV
jgi:hypothetical protein